MRENGYDVAKVDEDYNALGVIKGEGSGRNLLMNGHIDHVPVGDMGDPYSGDVLDGENFGVSGKVVYGRGACDMKGAVAAMILAGTLLKEINIKLKGDYKVAAVSKEEIGGAGTISSITNSHFIADVVLIGEATNMDIALGHRGSMKMTVVVKGRSCHASAPERGVNALYKAVKMINKIQSDLAQQLPDDPIYGQSTLVVTQIETKPKAVNVVPEECIFHIDCRHVPAFTAEDLYHRLKEIIHDIKRNDEDFEAFVLPSPLISERRFTGFYTAPEKYSVVEEAVNAVSEIYAKPELKVWTFATDGRIYSRLGIPVIGFGPGEERFAHTQHDHIKINDFLNAVKTYAYLACKICSVSKN
jgi:succinyl-diaminopimelate desuccinylase